MSKKLTDKEIYQLKQFMSQLFKIHYLFKMYLVRLIIINYILKVELSLKGNRIEIPAACIAIFAPAGVCSVK